MRGSLIDWWLMVLMCHVQSIHCIHHVETLKPVKNCCSAAASANQRLPDISRWSQLSQPKFATSNELIWQCLWYVIALYIYVYIYTYIIYIYTYHIYIYTTILYHHLAITSPIFLPLLLSPAHPWYVWGIRIGRQRRKMREPSSAVRTWWIWIWYGYGSIPINTIFRGMNIHLPAILMFTRGTRFWPIPIWFLEFDHQGFTIWLFNTAMERSTHFIAR